MGLATRRDVVGVALALVVAGCSDSARVSCDFGDEVVIDDAPYHFDAVGAVAAEGQHRTFWNTPSGAFTRTGETSRRFDESCDTLAVVADADDTIVACGRRPIAAKDAPGSVSVLRVRDGAVVARSVPVRGAVGRDHAGLDIAVAADGPVLVWQDGRPGDWGVWSVQLGPDLVARDEPRRLSSARVSAGRPATLAGDPLLVTWAENWIEGGVSSGQVLVSDGRGRPTRVAEVILQDPVPILARDDAGVVVFFRDVRRPRRRTSLFAQRLDSNLSTRGEAIRVGRSDGRGAPRVTRCAGYLAVATPRSFGRTEVLVGVYVLNEALEQVVKEQQVYQWAAQFTSADIVCLDDTLQLLVGQRSHLEGDRATLHSLPLRCE